MIFVRPDDLIGAEIIHILGYSDHRYRMSNMLVKLKSGTYAEIAVNNPTGIEYFDAVVHDDLEDFAKEIINEYEV